MTKYRETLRCFHNLVAELGWEITDVGTHHIQFIAPSDNAQYEIRLTWDNDQWVYEWWKLSTDKYYSATGDDVDFWSTDTGFAIVMNDQNKVILEHHFGDYKEE